MGKSPGLKYSFSPVPLNQSDSEIPLASKILNHHDIHTRQSKLFEVLSHNHAEQTPLGITFIHY